MTLDADRIDRPAEDPVSNVLKWVLLVVAIGCFALLAWATMVTYQTVAPQPDRFVTADGSVLMTGEDIAQGKAGFQKADLMDYGSLYGMGSYYGEDYTASSLSQRSATGSTASATATTSASMRSAACSPRRAPSSAGRGQTTLKEPCGSCGSGCGMLRHGSRTGVLLMGESCC